MDQKNQRPQPTPPLRKKLQGNEAYFSNRFGWARPETRLPHRSAATNNIHFVLPFAALIWGNLIQMLARSAKFSSAKDFCGIVVFLYEDTNSIMKNSLPWAAGVLAVTLTSALAQPQPAQPMRMPGPPAAPTLIPTPGMRMPMGMSQPQPAELTRFSLDFPGGTPGALVAAIEKAMGKPLNAIVPDEYADIKIPALKMSNVNVANLFAALEQASRKSQAYETGSYYGGGAFGGYRSLQTVITSYGFEQAPGPLTDDTIWYFHADKPPVPTIGSTGQAKTVRFYSLEPYLHARRGERELTVDDITTAIETGWKMLGETSPPKISFHKDTNLLIAVGEPNKLEIIDAVLKALTPQAAPAAPGKAAAPKPADSPRSAESSKPGSE